MPSRALQVESIDTSTAEKVKGVAAVRPMKKPGDEIFWQGDLIVCVAGETEGVLAEGLAAIKAEYELLDVFVNEEDLAAAEAAKRTAKSGGKVQLKNEPEGDDKDFEEKELARAAQGSRRRRRGLLRHPRHHAHVPGAARIDL